MIIQKNVVPPSLAFFDKYPQTPVRTCICFQTFSNDCRARSDACSKTNAPFLEISRMRTTRVNLGDMIKCAEINKKKSCINTVVRKTTRRQTRETAS